MYCIGWYIRPDVELVCVSVHSELVTSHEFRVHADTHKFNIWLNISTNMCTHILMDLPLCILYRLIYSARCWTCASRRVLRTRDRSWVLNACWHTHKFNSWPNISTDTIYTTEDPLIYECMYPTTNQCSYTRILYGMSGPNIFKFSANYQKTCVQPVNRSSFGHKQKVMNLW